MFTSLDLLVVIFMVLAAASILSALLMFLAGNKTAKKVFYTIFSVLGLYVSWAGFRIGVGGLFTVQIVIGVLTALLIVGAYVFQLASKGNEKAFLAARVVAAATAVVALANVAL